jgi:hypothetical protein
MAKNISGTIAWDLKYDIELWNLDETRNKISDTALSLPIFAEIARGDFIKPRWSTRPRTILDNAKTSGRLKDGDRLAGYGAITCSNCKYVRWYWLFYVEAKGGWYSPIPTGQAPDPKGWVKALSVMANNPESGFPIPESARHTIGDFPQ